MRVSIQYIREDEIVLNIGPTVSHNLNTDSEWVNFSVRFNGIAHDIQISAGHAVSIFAHGSEEGAGPEVKPYQLENAPTQEQMPQSESKDTESVKPRKRLKLVK